MEKACNYSTYVHSIDKTQSSFYKKYNKWQLSSTSDSIQDYFFKKIVNEKIKSEKSISPFFEYNSEIWDIERLSLSYRHSLLFPKATSWSLISVKNHSNLIKPASNKTIKTHTTDGYVIHNLGLFKSEKGYFNLGKSITHLAWCPIISPENQILACLVTPDEKKQNKSNLKEIDNGISLIHILDYGIIKKSPLKPIMKYSIMIDWGKINRMIWISPDQIKTKYITSYPFKSSNFESPQELHGHLLFSCHDGFLRIIPIPKFSEDQLETFVKNLSDFGEFPILQIDKSNIMKLGMSTSYLNETLSQFGYPTCVDWKNKFPSKLVVGFSEGYVAIFDLSCAHHTRYDYTNHYLSPIFKKRYSYSAVTAVSFTSIKWQQFNITVAPNPENLTNFSVDMSTRREPIDVIQSHKQLFTVLLPSRADIMVSVPSSRDKLMIKSILSHDTAIIPIGGIMSVSFCDLLNSVIVVTESGSLVCVSLSNPNFIQAIVGSNDSIDLSDIPYEIRYYRNTREKDVKDNYNEIIIDCKYKSDLLQLYDSHPVIGYPSISSVSVNPNVSANGWVAVGMECGLLHIVKFTERDMSPIFEPVVKCKMENIKSSDLTAAAPSKQITNVRNVVSTKPVDKKKLKQAKVKKEVVSFNDIETLSKIIFTEPVKAASNKTKEDFSTLLSSKKLTSNRKIHSDESKTNLRTRRKSKTSTSQSDHSSSTVDMVESTSKNDGKIHRKKNESKFENFMKEIHDSDSQDSNTTEEMRYENCDDFNITISDELKTEVANVNSQEIVEICTFSSEESKERTSASFLTNVMLNSEISETVDAIEESVLETDTVNSVSQMSEKEDSTITNTSNDTDLAILDYAAVEDIFKEHPVNENEVYPKETNSEFFIEYNDDEQIKSVLCTVLDNVTSKITDEHAPESSTHAMTFNDQILDCKILEETTKTNDIIDNVNTMVFADENIVPFEMAKSDIPEDTNIPNIADEVESYIIIETLDLKGDFIQNNIEENCPVLSSNVKTDSVCEPSQEDGSSAINRRSPSDTYPHSVESVQRLVPYSSDCDSEDDVSNSNHYKPRENDSPKTEKTLVSDPDIVDLSFVNVATKLNHDQIDTVEASDCNVKLEFCEFSLIPDKSIPQNVELSNDVESEMFVETKVSYLGTDDLSLENTATNSSQVQIELGKCDVKPEILEDGLTKSFLISDESIIQNVEIPNDVDKEIFVEIVVSYSGTDENIPSQIETIEARECNVKLEVSNDESTQSSLIYNESITKNVEITSDAEKKAFDITVSLDLSADDLSPGNVSAQSNQDQIDDFESSELNVKQEILEDELIQSSLVCDELITNNAENETLGKIELSDSGADDLSVGNVAVQPNQSQENIELDKFNVKLEILNDELAQCSLICDRSFTKNVEMFIDVVNEVYNKTVVSDSSSDGLSLRNVAAQSNQDQIDSFEVSGCNVKLEIVEDGSIQSSLICDESIAKNVENVSFGKTVLLDLGTDELSLGNVALQSNQNQVETIERNECNVKLEVLEDELIQSSLICDESITKSAENEVFGKTIVSDSDTEDLLSGNAATKFNQDQIETIEASECSVKLETPNVDFPQSSSIYNESILKDVEMTNDEENEAFDKTVSLDLSTDDLSLGNVVAKCDQDQIDVFEANELNVKHEILEDELIKSSLVCDESITNNAENDLLDKIVLSDSGTEDLSLRNVAAQPNPIEIDIIDLSKCNLNLDILNYELITKDVEISSDAENVSFCQISEDTNLEADKSVKATNPILILDHIVTENLPLITTANPSQNSVTEKTFSKISPETNQVNSTGKIQIIFDDSDFDVEYSDYEYRSVETDSSITNDNVQICSQEDSFLQNEENTNFEMTVEGAIDIDKLTYEDSNSEDVQIIEECVQITELRKKQSCENIFKIFSDMQYIPFSKTEEIENLPKSKALDAEIKRKVDIDGKGVEEIGSLKQLIPESEVMNEVIAERKDFPFFEEKTEMVLKDMQFSNDYLTNPIENLQKPTFHLEIFSTETMKTVKHKIFENMKDYDLETEVKKEMTFGRLTNYESVDEHHTAINSACENQISESITPVIGLGETLVIIRDDISSPEILSSKTIGHHLEMDVSEINKSADKNETIKDCAEVEMLSLNCKTERKCEINIDTSESSLRDNNDCSTLLVDRLKVNAEQVKSEIFLSNVENNIGPTDINSGQNENSTDTTRINIDHNNIDIAPAEQTIEINKSNIYVIGIDSVQNNITTGLIENDNDVIESNMVQKNISNNQIESNMDSKNSSTSSKENDIEQKNSDGDLIKSGFEQNCSSTDAIDSESDKKDSEIDFIESVTEPKNSNTDLIENVINQNYINNWTTESTIVNQNGFNDISESECHQNHDRVETNIDQISDNTTQIDSDSKLNQSKCMKDGKLNLLLSNSIEEIFEHEEKTFVNLNELPDLSQDENITDVFDKDSDIQISQECINPKRYLIVKIESIVNQETAISTSKSIVIHDTEQKKLNKSDSAKISQTQKEDNSIALQYIDSLDKSHENDSVQSKSVDSFDTAAPTRKRRLSAIERNNVNLDNNKFAEQLNSIHLKEKFSVPKHKTNVEKKLCVKNLIMDSKGIDSSLAKTKLNSEIEPREPICETFLPTIGPSEVVKFRKRKLVQEISTKSNKKIKNVEPVLVKTLQKGTKNSPMNFPEAPVTSNKVTFNKTVRNTAKTSENPETKVVAVEIKTQEKSTIKSKKISDDRKDDPRKTSNSVVIKKEASINKIRINTSNVVDKLNAVEIKNEEIFPKRKLRSSQDENITELQNVKLDIKTPSKLHTINDFKKHSKLKENLKFESTSLDLICSTPILRNRSTKNICFGADIDEMVQNVSTKDKFETRTSNRLRTVDKAASLSSHTLSESINEQNNDSDNKVIPLRVSHRLSLKNAVASISFSKKVTGSSDADLSIVKSNVSSKKITGSSDADLSIVKSNVSSKKIKLEVESVVSSTSNSMHSQESLGSSGKSKRKRKTPKCLNWWSNLLIEIVWLDEKYSGGKQIIRGFLLDNEPVLDQEILVRWPKSNAPNKYPAIVRKIYEVDK